MTAPSTFQFYEGEGPLYAVTVSARSSHHGRSFLHTFAYRERGEANGFAYGDRADVWVVATPLTRKQIDHAERQRGITRAPWFTERRRGGGEQGDDLSPGSFMSIDAESERPVRLADGVDVSPQALCLILDALRSAGRHEVDVDDIKVVMSQLGSLLNRLASLDDDARRNARPALYAEIMLRCTRL